MNQYNNAYTLREIVKKLKSKGNSKEALLELETFLENNKEYNRFEIFKILNELLKNGNIQGPYNNLIDMINDFIYEIEIENNDYIKDYSYVESTINKVVSEIYLKKH